LLNYLFAKEKNYGFGLLTFAITSLSSSYFLFSFYFKMKLSTVQFIATKIRSIEATLFLK